MNKKKIFALILAGVLTSSCLMLTGCGKSKDDTADIKTIDEAEDEQLSDLDWPDRGEEMADIIDAVIMANTEHPEITYTTEDNTSFWTYMHYVLVKVGSTYNLAVDDDGDGKYSISTAAVKVFARAVFNSFDGTLNLPSLPDGFDGITYDADSDTYSYWDTGLSLGMTEVYAVGDKQDDGTYITVSYMIDSSDANNTTVVPWKVAILDSRTSSDETPVYAYRITSVEKVEE